jgi:hypothetical protein
LNNNKLKSLIYIKSSTSQQWYDASKWLLWLTIL